MMKKIEVTGYSNLQRNKNEQEIIDKWTAEGWEVVDIIRGDYKEKSYVCFEKPQKRTVTENTIVDSVETANVKVDDTRTGSKENNTRADDISPDSTTVKITDTPGFTAEFEKSTYTDIKPKPKPKTNTRKSGSSEAQKNYPLQFIARDSYETIEKKIHFTIGQDLTKEQAEEHIKKIVRKWQRSRWEIVEKSDGSDGKEPYIVAVKVNKIETEKPSALKFTAGDDDAQISSYQTEKPQSFYTDEEQKPEQQGSSLSGCLIVVIFVLIAILIF